MAAQIARLVPNYEPVRGSLSYLLGIAVGSFTDVAVMAGILKLSLDEPQLVYKAPLASALIFGSVEAALGVFLLDMLDRQGMTSQNLMLYSVGYFPQLSTARLAGTGLSAWVLGML